MHRDVKPGNVLLARQRGSEAGEHVYLSDFGLTKRSASDSGITGTGQFVGTLDYAAPEQFKGVTPDERTDVYSLGCVLFECLTGEPPFTSENDAGLMYAHLQEPPPSVTACTRAASRIDGVVAKAMAKAPPDRQRGGSARERSGPRARCRRRCFDRHDPRTEGPPSVAPGDRRSGGTLGGDRAGIRLPQRAAAGRGGASCLTSGDRESHARPGIPDGPSRPRSRGGATPQLDPRGRQLGLLATRSAGTRSGRAAALVCHAGDVEVLYELFPTQSDMNTAIQEQREQPSGAQRSVRDRDAGRDPVHDRRVASRSRALLHAQARRGRSITHRVDLRGQLDLRTCGSERPRGPQPLRRWLSTSGPVASNGDATATRTRRPRSDLGSATGLT